MTFIFLFVLLLIGLPLGEFSRVTILPNISFTFLDIIVLLGFSSWVIAKFVKKSRPTSLQSYAYIAVVAVFALSLLSNIISLTVPKAFVSSLYIVRWICYSGIFFLVAQESRKRKQSISYLLIFSGTLLVAGGYMQFFFYPALRNLLYFGWDEHFYRMFGSFFDPNFFGLFLSLFFLYIISLTFSLVPTKQKIQFVTLFLIATATFIAIFLTYSRTALIALSVGLIILFWNRHFWRWIWIFLIAGTITAFFVFPLISKQALGNNLFRTASTDARIGSAKDALTIFMDNPVMGIGFNAYRFAMYRHKFLPGNSILEDHGASGVDSSILLILATSGVLGFVTYSGFLLIHVKKLLESKEKIGIATLVTVYVGSFFVNALFYPFIIVWLWCIAGLTEKT